MLARVGNVRTITGHGGGGPSWLQTTAVIATLAYTILSQPDAPLFAYESMRDRGLKADIPVLTRHLRPLRDGAGCRRLYASLEGSRISRHNRDLKRQYPPHVPPKAGDYVPRTLPHSLTLLLHYSTALFSASFRIRRCPPPPIQPLIFSRCNLPAEYMRAGGRIGELIWPLYHFEE